MRREIYPNENGRPTRTEVQVCDNDREEGTYQFLVSMRQLLGNAAAPVGGKGGIAAAS